MEEQSRLNLLFIRHGQTLDNVHRILQGFRDTELTAQGHREALVLAEKLQTTKIHVVYHSPLVRIVQTIKPILDARSEIEEGEEVKVIADRDLRGQGLGELEGRSYDTIDMGDPRSADGKPGVELFDDFVGRLKTCLGRIIGAEVPRVINGTGGGDRNVVIATHGVGITSIFKMLEATKLAVRGPDAYEVRWTDSDDVAKLVVLQPEILPLKNGILDWEAVSGQPFLIETWGKKEKAIISK